MRKSLFNVVVSAVKGYLPTSGGASSLDGECRSEYKCTGWQWPMALQLTVQRSERFKVPTERRKNIKSCGGGGGRDHFTRSGLETEISILQSQPAQLSEGEELVLNHRHYKKINLAKVYQLLFFLLLYKV